MVGIDSARERALLEDQSALESYPPKVDITKKNVIIIFADSLRADHLKAYGYARDTTPYLTSLFQLGKLQKVENAFSTCAESYCGISTTLTSHHFHEVSARSLKLYQLLGRIGYKTHLYLSGDHDTWNHLSDFYSSYVPDRLWTVSDSKQYGITDDNLIIEGLDAMESASNDSEPHFFMFFLMSSHFEGQRYAKFNRWFDNQSKKAEVQALVKLRQLGTVLGVLVNSGDGHVSERQNQEAVDNYDNGLFQMDDFVRKIMEILEEKGYLDNYVMAIMGDHGEGLGEHGHFGHTRYLYNEDIRIPLFFLDSEGKRLTHTFFASQIDVAPTLLDYLKISIPSSWRGNSLLSDRKKDYSLHQSVRGRNICRAVIMFHGDDLWKYIRCLDKVEIYNLNKDPRERNNLIENISGRLQSRFEEILAPLPKSVEIDCGEDLCQ